MHIVFLRFFFTFFLKFYSAPIGLDWKELEELLNPKFDWEAAVQTAMGTDDSLNEVCTLVVCYLYVYELSQELGFTMYEHI